MWAVMVVVLVYLPLPLAVLFAILFFLFRWLDRRHAAKMPDEMHRGWRWKLMFACGFNAVLFLMIAAGNFFQMLLSRA